MGHLGTIRVGETDLDDRLREVLEGSGLEREEFEDLDWFGLLPFFALAGASLRTDVEAHGDHFHFRGVSLEIADELEEAFFSVLPQILEQLSDEEQAAAEQASAPEAVVHPPKPEREPDADDRPSDDEEPSDRDEEGAARSPAATGSTATSSAGAEPTDDISESPDRDVTR